MFESNIINIISQQMYHNLGRWDQIIYILVFNNYRYSNLSWSQPVLYNEGKDSCSVKLREPLIGLELTTDQLLVQHSTHCPTWPLIGILSIVFFSIVNMYKHCNL